MMKGQVKHTILWYLDTLKAPQVIGGWPLRDRIAAVSGYQVYPNVVLKVCKHWARLSGGAFDCIDKKRSLYQFEPGKRKVAGTSFESLPVESRVKEYKKERGKA